MKCDKSLDFKGGNHKYCDTCRVAVKKEKSRLRRERYHRLHSHFCINCGCIIYDYHGHGQKYCRDCSLIIKKEMDRLSFLRYYVRNRELLPKTLGASNLLSNPKSDFNEEFERVGNEMRRFGLANWREVV